MSTMSCGGSMSRPQHPLAARAGLLTFSAFLLGCISRPVMDPDPSSGKQNAYSFPQTLEKDVDILFVVDDSESMLGEQESLADNFPRLINALRSEKLGPAPGGGRCSPEDESGCNLPNVHIGVISTDLGAGPHTDVESCKTPGGEQGKLLAGGTGCPRPDDAWISYNPDTGATNVRSSGGDPVDQVAEAFTCMAKLGAAGCGYEQQLEAARLALDPAVQTNPGFVRDEALLAVVFITDEDDCSAADTSIYNNKDLRFGPSNWRCFEAGVECDGPEGSLREPGLHQNCRVRRNGNLLKPVVRSQSGNTGKSYEEFFKGLKKRRNGKPRPGRVIMAAIAGPPEPIEVGTEQGAPNLAPSCTFKLNNDDKTKAFPAVRIASLVSSFDTLSDEIPGTFSKICPERDGDDNFARALAEVGRRIRGALGRQCLSAPLLREAGGLACSGGEALGGGISCRSPGCLHEVDCQVEEASDDGRAAEVPRCPVALFNAPEATSCGEAPCPCWRVIPDPGCSAERDGTPYAFQILRPPQTEAPKGTFADVTCKTSPHLWGSAPLFTSLDDDKDGSPERICQ